jgi:hypothetical protein
MGLCGPAVEAIGCICLDGAGLYSCIGTAGMAIAVADIYGKVGYAASGAVRGIDKAAVMIWRVRDKWFGRRCGLQSPET